MSDTKPRSFVMVTVDKIVILPEIQVRCRVHEDTVKEYTAVLEAEGEFEPIHLFVDTDDRKILSDGWHRLLAHQAAGRKSIKAILHEDDPENAVKNAIEFAIEHTASHGLPPSPEDKRKMVLMALQNWPKRSDKALSRLCRVSPGLVAKIREKGITAPKERKRRTTNVKEHERALPGQQEQPEPSPKGKETSPLLERVKTLQTWVREGHLDFPDIREVFETKTAIPMMIPKGIESVLLIPKDAPPVHLAVQGLRVKGGVVELATSAEALRKVTV